MQVAIKAMLYKLYTCKFMQISYIYILASKAV